MLGITIQSTIPLYFKHKGICYMELSVLTKLSEVLERWDVDWVLYFWRMACKTEINAEFQLTHNHNKFISGRTL